MLHAEEFLTTSISKIIKAQKLMPAASYIRTFSAWNMENLM
jgi:hypothetical protein